MNGPVSAPDPAPRFRCAACDRGVLNGDFPRCLYCGADLPPAVARAAAERRAAVQSGLASSPTRAAAPMPVAESGNGSVIEGIADAIDIAGTIADGISIIGDLLD